MPTLREYVDIGIQRLNSLLNKKPFYFDNVLDMKTSSYLRSGDLVITKGYYVNNDGGNGKYEIVSDNTLINDGGGIIDLEGGLKAKLIIENGSVNIKQFGAREGENVLNNTYIQNALNYAYTANINNVLIPSGTFYVDVSNPIMIPNNTRLHGASYNSIIKANKGTYIENTQDSYNHCKNTIICTGYIYDANSTLEDKNITISDLYIDGNITEDIDLDWYNNANYWNCGYGLFVGYSGNVTVENVIIKNTLGSGIATDRSYNLRFDKCLIDNCGNYNKSTGSKNGISITGITDIKYKPNVITNCIIQNCLDEAIQYAHSPMIITNNYLLNNKDCGIEGDTAFKTDDIDENNRGDCIISNNYIYGNKKGISIGNANNQKVVISNNIIKKCTRFIIDVVQSNGGKVIITDNIMSDLTCTEDYNAFYFQAKSCVFSNNTIYGLTLSKQNFFNFLSDYVVFEGNNIYDLEGASSAVIVSKVVNLTVNNNNFYGTDIGCYRFLVFANKYIKNLTVSNNNIKNINNSIIFSYGIDGLSMISLNVSDNKFINCTSGTWVNVMHFENSSAPTTNNTIEVLNINSNIVYKTDTTKTFQNFVLADQYTTINNLIYYANIVNSNYLTSNEKNIVNTPSNIQGF
jgi:hypothetical protein